MIQNYLHDEFDRDYAPIAAIQHGAPIEFNISGASQLYCDLNNLLLRVRARVLDGGDHVPGAGDHPGVINNPFNSMWRDHSLTLNGRCVTEPNNMYPWRAYISSLLNYTNEVQNTRLQCECWLRDTAGHLDSRNHDGDNIGFNTRAGRFARGQVMEMIGRPHLDLFQQDKLLPPGINIAYRLTPAADHFVIKAPDNDNTQYRMVIRLWSCSCTPSS